MSDTVRQLVQDVIRKAPEGPYTDAGILLNRCIRACPEGTAATTVSELRQMLAAETQNMITSKVGW